MHTEKIVLIVYPYYLPGNRAGGPVQTIANMVEWLGNSYKFLILTGDKDLGMTSSYEKVNFGSWNQVGLAQVRYLRPYEQRMERLRKIIQQCEYDILYLGSAIHPLIIKFLLLRRLKLISRKPTLISPRGIFADDAFSSKAIKKRLYFWIAQQTGLYSDAIWIAASKNEATDVERRIDFSSSKSNAIHMLPNMSRPSVNGKFECQGPYKISGKAKLVYIARIAPIKNLLFALHMLRNIVGEIEFDIYGPIENKEYWSKCEETMKMLPRNINVHYHGILPAEKVSEVFMNSHFLYLPTKTENFGHSIIESLCSGCPVLISDRTPWRQLYELHAGWDISLDRAELFRKALQTIVAMDQDEYIQWSSGARKAGHYFVNSDKLLQEYLDLFSSITTSLT